MSGRATRVLDHGYLHEIEAWGSDIAIIEAARMSTNKGFLGWEPEWAWKCADCTYTCVTTTDPAKMAMVCLNGHGPLAEDRERSHQGDMKLLSYLWTHKHATPFEMAGMIIEVQAPIFVFREWHRHRTQSYNEMSARYVPLPDVNYVPSVERLMINAGGTNRQAGTMPGSEKLTTAAAEVFQDALIKHYAGAQSLYEFALAHGVPKELARVHLPVGRYSRMRASANLRNWLAFLTLRMDPAAQYEIRMYANALGALIAQRFPRTWALFTGGHVATEGQKT